jgi:hypothetical protein
MAFPYRFDFEKASKIWKAAYKGWKLLNRSLILPNGFLNDIPVYITEFDFSTSNSVTGNKTFDSMELSDNIYIEPYSITLTVYCFGQEYKNELLKLRKLSRNKIGKDNILTLYYSKYSEKFFPLVITNMSFTDSATSTMFQEVKITLTNIDIREFMSYEGITTTSTLSRNNSVKITEPVKFDFPLNLQDELSKRDNLYSEVMKNGL